MPKLSDFIKNQEITLPVSKVTVTVTNAVTGLDFDKVKDSEQLGRELAVLVIKSWDFTDEQDQILAITIESYNLLPIPDQLKVAEYCKTLIEPYGGQ